MRKKKLTRQQWLYRLRRCHSLETLDKIRENCSYVLTPDELEYFWSAADHRLAELTMGMLYDRVPKEVWRHVR
ncbi:hemolysin expression modulator Hha [Citrobacter amalonaticus]|uniref:hemolysin expression modulator Hha n=1 Tax=Citrobacter amalonaticus TaxID=35703 RepID=UPI00339C2FD6